ncbi:hypothetical protein FNV43_RR17250 [Rhamnella rubrinervis]|uniref:RING-type E3 ubiquitin transferase n=1 Tax=Rhamnella rubrinervis TaxID=2594499 RepID=A0A8K0E3X4_9ROSA|nr:hypothetical protein FNV43_RR17250 [Rhamnella rubrinervis]
MMNGQGSHPNSSLANFFVDERPDTNNRGVVPANVSACEQFPANPTDFDGSVLLGWIGQSSSTMNTQNQERIGMILTNTPVTYHPSILEGAYSGALNSIELNTASEGNLNDANQGMPAGYVMEETQGREGLSDRRRLTYKRRAPEDEPRQLPLGVSSSSSQQVGNFELQAAHVQEDANISLNMSTPLFSTPNVSHPDQFESRLETGMTRTLSELYRTTTEARQAESFRRNIRMRRALASPRDFIPPSILSTGTRRYSHLQSPNQSAIFSPFDHVQNLSSATAVPVHAPPPVQSLSYAPDPLKILNPSPSVDVMRSRDTFSSISPAHMQQQWNMTNIPRSISVVPETERRNTVCSLTNLNFAMETADCENMASTSVNGFHSGVHVSAAPTWTQPHLTEQYEERFSNIINHSMNESAGFRLEGQDSFHTLRSSTHAVVRATESSVRGGNGRLSQVHRRPGLMTRPDRRDGGPENLPSAQSWARRGRLLSEVQNALALLRGNGTLGLEDVIIDDSVLFSVPEEHDVHEDMRLDVDNMSYEELLALEDDIGNVCTGLSEETILANLRRQKYQSVSTGSLAGDEPCCICQDEYVDEEDVGKLDCGHNFHFNCIKQWLVRKNSCPICKKTALPVKHN